MKEFDDQIWNSKILKFEWIFVRAYLQILNESCTLLTTSIYFVFTKVLSFSSFYLAIDVGFFAQHFVQSFLIWWRCQELFRASEGKSCKRNLDRKISPKSGLTSLMVRFEVQFKSKLVTWFKLNKYATNEFRTTFSLRKDKIQLIGMFPSPLIILSFVVKASSAKQLL